MNKLTVSAAIALLALGQSAQAMVVNGDFSSGFDGWQGTGVSGEFFNLGYAVAASGSGDVSQAEVESFLGLSTSLDDLGFGNATEGSAFKQDITVEAGDVLTFDFNFLTNEYTPSDYNDFGFFSVSPDPISLASTGSDFVSSAMILDGVGFESETGDQSYSYTFASAGTFTIGFGAMNEGDNSVASALLIDDVTLSSSVPEPSTLGLLAIGLVGLGLARKRLS